MLTTQGMTPPEQDFPYVNTTDTRTVRLFLVDAHLLFREVLRPQLLRIPGAEVHHAGDAAGALTLFAQVWPDLVLLDVELPEGPSFPVARRMRCWRPACRIMFLTAHDYDARIERALLLEADAYILKSDELSSLFAAIRTVSEGGRYAQSFSHAT